MNNMNLNSIYEGKAETLLTLLDGESIDLVVTSPPYDKLRDYDGKTWNFQIFTQIAKELVRTLKKGGVIVWIVGDATINGSETGSSFQQALYFKELGLNLHDTMIYEKSGFANPSNNRYHQIFEYMFVFSKGKPKTFHPLKDKPNKTQYDFGKGRRKKDGTMSNEKDKSRIKVEPFGMRFNIWRYKTGRGNSTKDLIAYFHPAIFPEKLVQDHILSWSNEGETVLDPFLGSGTTAKMAKLNHRNYIGFEISSKYIDIANQRLVSIED